jgi:hypothetical protein
VVALNQEQEVTGSPQVPVGPIDQCSVHVAEVIGIFYAVSLVFKLAHENQGMPTLERISATILCDSKSALPAVRTQGSKTFTHFTGSFGGPNRRELSSPAMDARHCDDPGHAAAGDLPRQQRAPARHIHFVRYFQRRKRPFPTDSARSVNSDWIHPRRVVTFAGSTPRRRPHIPHGYMAHQGIEPTL